MVRSFPYWRRRRYRQLIQAKILRLSEDLPMVVEIVDNVKKIEKFLPLLDEMISDGLVTIQKVNVIEYNGGTLSK